jgi:hypothetical protein
MLTRSTAAVALTSCLSFGSLCFAAEPVVQKFGNWSVTIQPGLRGASPRDVRAESSPIKLVSQTEKKKTDAGDIPPSPQAPAVIAEDDAGPNIAGSVQNPCTNCQSVDGLSLVRLYPQVYNSIPFSRAEYEANPSYRHDATMEFLFGKMRPTVINRGVGNGGYGGYGNRGSWMTSRYSYPYWPYGFNSYYYDYFSAPYSSPYYHGYYRQYSLW